MEDEEKGLTPSEKPNRGLVAIAIILLCGAVIATGYALKERMDVNDLSAKNGDLWSKEQETSATLQKARETLATLSQKVDELNAAQAARETQAPVASSDSASKSASSQHAKSTRRAKKEDPRWKEMQSKLNEQQMEIAANEQDIQKTRSDLTDSVNSTKDELNGSIARNHDELVALEKKGERTYYEFDIPKSKQFKPVGPIGISLRHTNTKHQFCNLELVVDDKQLTKKHVDLYEPVMFYPADSKQPIELVINQIDKNTMHGYVSEPRNKEFRVTASNSANREAAASPSASSPSASSAPEKLEHRQPEEPKPPEEPNLPDAPL